MLFRNALNMLIMVFIVLPVFPGKVFSEETKNYDKRDPIIVEYRDRINISPNLKQAYYLRASEEADNVDYERAIYDYSRALEIDPNEAEIYNNRGIAYFEKTQYNEAIADFTKALAINPNLAQSYYNRGLVYSKKGQYSKAVSDYKSHKAYAG